MRKISSRKINIFVAMMLACALVLVGAASAYTIVYTDDYRLGFGGSSGSTTSYWASINTLDGEDAEYLSISVVLYDENGNYLNYVTDSAWDENSLTVQGYYSDQVTGGYIGVSFEAVNPDLPYCSFFYYF